MCTKFWKIIYTDFSEEYLEAKLGADVNNILTVTLKFSICITLNFAKTKIIQQIIEAQNSY